MSKKSKKQPVSTRPQTPKRVRDYVNNTVRSIRHWERVTARDRSEENQALEDMSRSFGLYDGQPGYH